MGSNTHTWTLYMLVVLIVAVGVFILYFFVYYPQLSAGATEMDAQAKCAKMADIRGSINQIEVGYVNVGEGLTSTDLLQLPEGCGVKYKSPCTDIADCQDKMRESIKICGEYMRADPETTATCLTSLEINETINTAAQLEKSVICAGGGDECDATGVNKDQIEHDTKPQGGDSISMEYGKYGELWIFSAGTNKVKISCMGKCTN